MGELNGFVAVLDPKADQWMNLDEIRDLPVSIVSSEGCFKVAWITLSSSTAVAVWLSSTGRASFFTDPGLMSSFLMIFPMA